MAVEPTTDSPKPVDAQSGAASTPTNQDITVFSDPINYNVKHPLHNAWTLWYDNPGKRNNQSTWQANLKELITFDCVEDFWGVYNNVVKASDLPIGATYHFFKAGIKPMWEDSANTAGGKWTIQFPRRVGEEVNKHWLNALLACIGENYDHENEVCGIVLAVRKAFFRLSLWTRTAANRTAAESIGRQLKQALEATTNLEYLPHDPAKAGISEQDGRIIV